MKFYTLIVLFMGLLLWGCRTRSGVTESCTFSKSTKIVPAIVQADTPGGNDVPPSKRWQALLPETQSGDTGSDLPADDDEPLAGKVPASQGAAVCGDFPEKTALGWRYCSAYRQPVWPSITPPPPRRA